MAAEVDREAFMRLMGLTAADVADPDTVPTRTAATRHQATSSPAPPGAAAAGGGFGGPNRKATPLTASSVGGLSHSASIGCDGERSPHWRGTLDARSSPRVHHTYTTSPQSDDALLRPSARSVSFDTSAHSATQQKRAPAASPSAAAASISEELKAQGNERFEAGDFAAAARLYTAAIDAVAPVASASPALLELLAALHSNRSAAHLQSARHFSSAEDAYARALCDADRAVALRPAWFKGYTRQGDAHFKLRRYGAAAEAYEMALQLDPRNTTLANALAETRQRAKQSAREEMELRRTMRSTGGHSHHSSTTSTAARGAAAEGGEEEERRFDASGTAANSTGSVGDGPKRRLSGQAQQLWADLKHEVEATTHQPTGDDYRLQQLEKFRRRGAAGTAQSSGSARVSDTAGDRQRSHDAEAESMAAARRAAPAAPEVFLVKKSAVQHDGSPSQHTTAAATPTAAAPGVASAAVPERTPVTAARLGSQSLSRSAFDAPTAGGIPAAMAAFRGPVTSARNVPYEFSSAAASAYQQQLLESFRQRKARQG